MKNFAIITPSYINSNDRFAYSKKANESLYTNTDFEFTHIVIDDIPRLNSFIPNFKHFGSAAKIYNHKNIILKRRFNQGSYDALKESIQIAKSLGKKYLYIHLDDCVYNNLFSNLVKSSITALEDNDNLALLRVSDHPLISSRNSKESGNSTFLNINHESIGFGNIKLSRKKYEDFTLWSSKFGSDTISKQFWPITLWGSVYRIEFLEQIISNTPENFRSRLGSIEKYYYDNWKDINKYFKDYSFGFINMQFGLFEMHRNKNWEELIQMSNNKIL